MTSIQIHKVKRIILNRHRHNEEIHVIDMTIRTSKDYYMISLFSNEEIEIESSKEEM